MNSNQWFTPANILQMISIGASTVLSIMIWWATRQSTKATKASAEATKASSDIAVATLELNKNLVEMQKQEFQSLKRVDRYRALKVADEVYSLLRNLGDPHKKQLIGDDVAHIRKYPKKPNLSPDEWAKYFTVEELMLVDRAWDEFDKYMKLWLYIDSQGSSQVRFPSAPSEYNDRVNGASVVLDLFYTLKTTLESS